MKTFLSLLFCSIIFSQTFSQNVAINNDGTPPSASAMLDIKNANKGLLIPRVSLVSETDAVTIPSPVLSLLVYNTNAALPEGAGFYFWNGNSKWSKLATSNSLNNFSWAVTGNTATNPNIDFIGTTDNQPLIFKTNNILSGKIAQGINSVFFGQHAGENVTTGTNNTLIGDAAGGSNTSGSNNLFIGHLAGNLNTIGSENVFVGQDAGKANTNGSRNVFVGEDAGISNTTGNDNIYVGNGAGRNSVNAVQQVAIGSEALAATTTGDYNVAVGYFSLKSATTGGYNTAAGHQSLQSLTNGQFNAAFGYNALFSNIAGSNNTAIGYKALYSNTTGYSNSAFGYQALFTNTTGYYNAAFGQSALNNNTTGDRNAAFGVDALRNNISGYQNTAFGNSALKDNYSGNFNTAVGYLSGPDYTALNNTTALGYQATVGTNNTMVFGNSSVDRWAFGLITTNANHAITVGSNFNNGNGAYLTQGGTWTNASSRIKKENFTNLNSNNLLHKISQLSIQKWKYKGSDEYHIGPVAEDFYAAFGLGTDDKGISTVDPAGIALAGMKELILINEKQNKLIEQLQERIEMLEKK